MLPFASTRKPSNSPAVDVGEQLRRAERAAVGGDFGDADMARAVLDVGAPVSAM